MKTMHEPPTDFDAEDAARFLARHPGAVTREEGVAALARVGRSLAPDADTGDEARAEPPTGSVEGLLADLGAGRGGDKGGDLVGRATRSQATNR